MAAGSDKAVFLSGSLMGHVVRMSLTASIGLMAMFAVDFVDMVFISMLGNQALAAAVGYAGTLLFFTNSINIGLSIAAGSLVARAVGGGRAADGRRYATNVAIFSLLTGLVLPVVILMNLTPILASLGAEGEVLRLAARYTVIILPTMGAVGVAMTAMAVLRAYGDARRSMMATLYGGIINAALAPVMIFALDMGLDGAAIATALARLTMLATAIWPAIRVHDAFARPALAPLAADFRAISGLALPAVLTNIATPVGNAIVTRELARFGTDAVAAMAVIGRLTPVAFAVIFALSGAIGPIIGQNFGAGRMDRVRAAFSAGVVFTAAYVAAVSVILFVLRAPLADLFDAEGQTRALIYLFCGPLAALMFFNGLIFVANASFNNLGHPLYSTAINWARHSIGTWPLAVLGASWAGAAGVLVGQAVGGVVFAALAWWLARRVMTSPPPDGPRGEAPWPQGRLHALTGRRDF